MNELSHDLDRENARALGATQRIKDSIQTLGGDAELAAAEHDAIRRSREDLSQQASVERANHQSEVRTIDPEAHDKGQRDASSAEFVRELDRRLEAASFGAGDWRQRQDLTAELRDLERVAAHDRGKAAQLWEKHRPNDPDQPAFIDGDDVRPSKVVEAAPLAVGRAEPDRQSDEPEKEFITPAALRKRYLQAENKFYFREETNKVAFEDKGKRLATEHNDPEIAKSMVELASAKGWTAIKLKGTDEFKREAWLHASLRGMEVQGYKPKDADRARLADGLTEQGRTADKSLNSIERSVPLDKEAVVDEQQRTLSAKQRTAIDHLKAILRERGDSEKAVDMAASMAAERFLTDRVHVGKIVEYGRAPYEHDNRNEESYYVKLQTADGERTVWGVDLKRATEEGKANVGDDVAVAYQGRQQVTVKVKDRDAQGNVTGEREMLTYRNTWEVNRLDKMREDVKEKMAQQARSGERQPQVLVYDRGADRAQPRPDLPPPQAKERERERARG